MMVTNNDKRCVRYEDSDFIITCDRLFSNGHEFVVVCSEESLEKCRKAADLFLRYDSQRPKKRWDNLKALAKLGAAGMRALPLMVVCNKATLLGWAVLVGNANNQVLRLTPKTPGIVSNQ